ncbi:MAG: hypothetical protein HY904_10045 [Deltaproteobacteria bacterium]|nr:hypothetical protein [Deltaproteobacteria bacterium]
MTAGWSSALVLAGLLAGQAGTEAPPAPADTPALPPPAEEPTPPPPAKEPPRRSVLLIPLEPRGGVTLDNAEVVTARVAEELGKLPGYQVFGLREMRQALNIEQLKMLSGCDSVSCVAEIAGALNSDEVVTGTVALVGKRHVLALKRVEARTALVVGQGGAEVRSSDPARVLAWIPYAVAMTFGRPLPPPPPPEPVVEEVPGWQQAPTRGPVPLGALAAFAATFGLALAADALGSLLLPIPVLGLVGVTLGGAAVLLAAPVAGLMMGSRVASKRVALLKAAGAGAAVDLVFMAPRVLFLAGTLGAMAWLAFQGALLIRAGNWVTPGHVLDRGVLTVAALYTAIAGTWAVTGLVCALANAAAVAVVTGVAGRPKYFWETGLQVDVATEPSPKESWVDFKVGQDTARE